MNAASIHPSRLLSAIPEYMVRAASVVSSTSMGSSIIVMVLRRMRTQRSPLDKYRTGPGGLRWTPSTFHHQRQPARQHASKQLQRPPPHPQNAGCLLACWLAAPPPPHLSIKLHVPDLIKLLCIECSRIWDRLHPRCLPPHVQRSRRVECVESVKWASWADWEWV